MAPSHPPSSQSKKQQSISSFFAPKPSTPSKPAPPRTVAATGQETRIESPPHIPSASERRIAGGSDAENEEPAPKRRRRSPASKVLLQPSLRPQTLSPDLAAAEQPTSSSAERLGGFTPRTSKYLFSSSPPLHSEDAAAPAGSEDELRRKQQLHRKFVQKLVRPDSIAEIKNRNRQADVDNDANGDGEHEEGDEDDGPAPRSIRAKKGRGEGGARAQGRLTPMEVQFLAIKEKNMDTIIAYQVGYKFRFFGEDARLAAKELGIFCVPGKLRFDGHACEAHYDRFASASFPLARLHVHVKRLVSAGHKVGVVRQLETAALKAAGDNRNAPFIRRLTNVYTKGTYIDDLEGLEGPVAEPVGSTSSTGFLLCLTETSSTGWGTDEKVHVGLIAVQLSTGTIIYDDFEDGFMRTEIETRVLHIAPCEYLIVGELSGASDKLIKHLSGSKSNVFGEQARVERVPKAKTMPAQAFSHISVFYTDKLRASGKMAEDGSETRLLDRIHQLSEHVTICLSAMISHLTEYGLQHIFDITTNFEAFSARTHMLLNGNTLGSLEIYRNQTDHTEKGTLFWTLDRTKTRSGKRMLRNWVGRPLLDKGQLEERLSAVEELLGSRQTQHVDRVNRVLTLAKSDLEKILVRIYYKKAARPELLAFLQTIQRISNVFVHVESTNANGFRSGLLNQAIAQLPQMGDNVVSILSRINLEAAKSDDKYSFFLSDYETEDISDQKLGIAAVEHELDEFRDKAAQKLGKKKIEYAVVSGIEYLIEVENSKLWLQRVPASWSKVSNTKRFSRFHAPEVVKMMRARDQHKELLAAACDDAFEGLLTEVAALYQPLRNCIQALAKLDCLMSLAEIASRPGYTKPAFFTEARIAVEAGRHPMVEQLLLDAYVPNDIHLSSVKSSDPSALLITGPNMGGKSSYVRSVALIAIMAQIGSYVPASKAQLGMLDAVFTRMGAADNLFRGESTFMVELGETSDILKQATPRSLVILDELGRGTSTHDGVAIAEAVMRELVERRVMTLFITHYQHLSRLQESCVGLQNVHMKFKESGEAGEEELTFLYEVGRGVAHRSYGLNVARLATVPKAVLDVAAIKSKELELSVTGRKFDNIFQMLKCMLDATQSNGHYMDRVVSAIEQL